MLRAASRGAAPPAARVVPVFRCQRRSLSTKKKSKEPSDEEDKPDFRLQLMDSTYQRVQRERAKRIQMAELRQATAQDGVGLRILSWVLGMGPAV